MRLLVIDPHGDALDFAMRAQRDGHSVRLAIKQTEHTKSIGRGIVPVVDDYRGWMRWADLVFMADNARYVYAMDQCWRSEGIKIIGPTVETALWEINRTGGMAVFRKAGIAVPDYKEFSDYDKAIAHVKKEDRRFVSKPCGNVTDKSLSYCAKSPVDMIYMLGRWKKAGKHKEPFILQEFISGTEMAVGGWFGPHGFNTGWCENWEFKKFMVDDLGVATGEQGTVLRYVRRSKLADKMLAPLVPQLTAANYVGYIDVNCIIDDKGQPWPLEFTCRPGWPTFNIQQELHEGDKAEWLMDLWNGRDAKNLVYNAIATGVVVSIPDYPYSHATRKEVVGVPIYVKDQDIWEHIHPCQVMMGNGPMEPSMLDVPMLVTAGDYVLVMSGTGTTVKESAESAYRNLESLTIPNSPMWRTDIGKRLKKQLPRLQAMGYASGMDWTPPLRLTA